jgi:hypothetical protein
VLRRRPMPAFIPARGRTPHLAGVCVNRIGTVQTMDHFNYPPAHAYCFSYGCEKQRVMPFGYFNGQTGYVELVDILGDDKTTVISSIICHMPADMKMRVCDAPDSVRWTERLNEATNTWEHVATVDP